jgi:23S rRNA pseudouridine1911/1915/1917 synthase
MDSGYTVLAEEPSFTVVSKAPGVLSQGDSSGDPDLVTLLTQRYGKKVYPVHRLDRGVGGVMVYARTPSAAASLCRAFASHEEAGKEYIAVLTGVPEEREGILTDYLFHDTRRRRTSVVTSSHPDAKEARLAYRLLSLADGERKTYSMVAVRLLTGRTHQIRAQFSARRLPLAGDGRYGAHDRFPGIALFSARLSFPHPETGKPLVFSAPIPDVMPFLLFSPSALADF